MAGMHLPQWLRHRRLSLKVVIVTVLLSSVVTLVATSIQLFVEYRRDLHTLEQTMTDARASFAQTLGASLWALDDEQLRLQLRGLQQLPHVDRVELRGDMNLSTGTEDDYPFRHESTIPVAHRTADGRRHDLGEVVIGANLAGLHARLWERLTVILATQAAKTFIVSLLLLLAIYYLVIRHLNTLAAFARDLRLDRLDERIALPRPADGPIRPDELDELSSAMNHAVERMCADMEHRQAAERSHRLLAGALEQCPAAVLILDRHGVLEYANPGFEAIAGVDTAQQTGEPCLGHDGWLTPLIAVADGQQDIWPGVDREGAWQGEIRLRRPDGQFRWLRASLRAITTQNDSHVIALLEDLTELRAVEERLDYQTHFDRLTGLPNRQLIQQLLSAALGQSGDQDSAVMLLDIDRFNLVNETDGPDGGDEILRALAGRLRELTSGEWQVGRLGNDEFLLVASGQYDPEQLERIAGQLSNNLRNTTLPEGHPFVISVCIGIARSPGAGHSVSDILRAADSALQTAKARGAGSIAVFDAQLHQRAQRRLMMDADLHAALAKGEFELHYQPIVDAHDRHPVVLEALLRWRHPEQGMIPPDEFIGIAEDNGLIVPLGEWVLRQSLSDLAELRRTDHLSNLRVSVNVSPRQLEERLFPDAVEAALAAAGLPGEAVQIEITERLFLQDIAQSRAALERIGRLGVSVAIDDFGTGYSALSYLKRLHVNNLKIDRSFVRDVFDDPNDAQLIQAVLSLGHGLGLSVTAEGVETEEQFGFLRDLGCDFIQGYHCGRPAPRQDLERRLQGESFHA